MTTRLEAFIEKSRTDVVDEFKRRLFNCAADCESPIESAMFWALVGSQMDAGFNVVPIDGWVMCPGGETEEGFIGPNRPSVRMGNGLLLVTQLPIVAGDGSRYRLDLAMSSRRNWPDRTIKDSWIAIECDGHEFHEKTKEQAQRDKKRDRDIQALGYRIARFAGSEIFKDARACAWDAFSILLADVTRAWQEHRAKSEEP